jgi:hypothetical protein
MQGFSVKRKTSGISSSSTSWQDLEAQYKSCNEANMTPRSPVTKPEKMTNSEDLVRKVSILEGQGASSNSERHWRQGPTYGRGKDLEDLGTDTGRRRPQTEPKWAQAGRPRPVGPGRPAQPISGPSRTPFDLGASQAIYSPLTESHASIHSSSSVDVQRREGHRSGEERVEMVD